MMSANNLTKLILPLTLVCLVLLLFVHRSLELPTAFRNHLFDLDTASDTSNPEFARPDEGDLQRNSARLHRTLFLLDTSDLLKNARLFGEKANKRTKERMIRAKRFIVVRKPTLTLKDSDQDTPSLKIDPNQELNKAVST